MRVKDRMRYAAFVQTTLTIGGCKCGIYQVYNSPLYIYIDVGAWRKGVRANPFLWSNQRGSPSDIDQAPRGVLGYSVNGGPASGV